MRRINPPSKTLDSSHRLRKSWASARGLNRMAATLAMAATSRRQGCRAGVNDYRDDGDHVHLSILPKNPRLGKSAGLPCLCAATFIAGNIRQGTLSYDEDTSTRLVARQKQRCRLHKRVPRAVAAFGGNPQTFRAPGGLAATLERPCRAGNYAGQAAMRSKSMKPRSAFTPMSRTRICSPRSRPRSPRTIRPSAGTLNSRA